MAQIDDGENPLALSDEDFLSQNAPPADPEVEAKADTSESDDNTDDDDDDANADTSGTGDDADEPSKDDDKSDAEGEGDGKKSEDGNSSGEESPDDKTETDPDSGDDADPKADPKKDGENKEGEPAKADLSDPAPKSDPAAKAADKPVVEPVTDADAKAFYEKVMAPFNANGKKIELKSPDEAIQLMQMGANYTRKMQELQPHRKTLLMLQNNELTDPEQISFLIDVAKGDPEAIKKLLKDTGIDPLDIDLSTDSEYTGGGNAVSDSEVKFRTTIDELKADEDGSETIAEMNNRWDKTSKDLLWESPEIMTVIHSQRKNGIYDTIKDEMDRRITLGQIDASMPFLQAYKLVGDEMAQAVIGNNEDGQISEPDKQPDKKVEAEPIATKIAAPKPKLDNDEAAKGLAPGRQSPNPNRGKINPLALSDEDFLKQMENRV